MQNIRSMKKKFIVVLSLLGVALCANADKQYMIVEQLDESKYSFLLDDNPIVTHEDGNLVVNGDAATSYAISSVKRFYFAEDAVSGVEKQTSDVFCIVSLDESTLQVLNAQPAESVTLVSVDGKVILTSTTDMNGSAIVKLPGRGGVYVLTVGTKSIKVIRK